MNSPEETLYHSPSILTLEGLLITLFPLICHYGSVCHKVITHSQKVPHPSVLVGVCISMIHAWRYEAFSLDNSLTRMAHTVFSNNQSGKKVPSKKILIEKGSYE